MIAILRAIYSIDAPVNVSKRVSTTVPRNTNRAPLQWVAIVAGAVILFVTVIPFLRHIRVSLTLPLLDFYKPDKYADIRRF